MDFINFHIAYLLTKHKHVIIPDFGAFIVSKRKEDKPDRRGMISPPVKYSLSFNPEMIKDDGLLVHSIAKEKNIDSGEALRLVYEYVDSLVDDLRTGKTIQFPWIGKIHLSEDRKIVFTPELNLSCNASGCGLVDLNFPSLNEISEDDFAGQRKKNCKRPLVGVIIAVVVLAAVLAALMTVTPLRSFNDLISLFDMKTVKDTDSPVPTVSAISSGDIDSTAAPVVVDSVQTQPQYFIIVTSLTEEKEAEEILNYLMSKGMDEVKIIHSDGKYRISIKSFTNKEEAVSFLNLIRKEQENPLFKDAWILDGIGTVADPFHE
ncbi:MAG: SPOR domain-containing protein [Dysgonamonadaceae bacterium]|jgi:nucleoid DNA-binding protein|nr:SPOR domain-containing protein [Dysgonamonadaceae bacterium]